MITFFLNGIFIIFVLLKSLKRKEYRYTVTAAITLLYFVFATLQSNYDLIESAHAFGWVQKIMLLILAVYMAFVLIKSSDRKTDLPPVIFACIACAFRFIRTLVFIFYTGNMQVPGADVQTIYQEFSMYYVIVDSVTRFALVLMLFSIAWKLGKPASTNV